MTEYEIGAILHKLGGIEESQRREEAAGAVRTEQLDNLQSSARETINGMDHLRSAMRRNEEGWTKLEARVSAIEAPIAKAAEDAARLAELLAKRQKHRNKVAGWIVATAVVLWAFTEPVYTRLLDWLSKPWTTGGHT